MHFDFSRSYPNNQKIREYLHNNNFFFVFDFVKLKKHVEHLKYNELHNFSKTKTKYKVKHYNML